MSNTSTLEVVLKLPVEQRLALLEAIWDSLAREPERVPVPDWHREILAERIATDEADPSNGEDWDTVRRQIERGL